MVSPSRTLTTLLEKSAATAALAKRMWRSTAQTVTMRPLGYMRFTRQIEKQEADSMIRITMTLEQMWASR